MIRRWSRISPVFLAWITSTSDLCVLHFPWLSRHARRTLTLEVRLMCGSSSRLCCWCLPPWQESSLRYRTQRVLFHASSQFLLGIMSGLILFTVGLIVTRASPQRSELCKREALPALSSPIPGAGFLACQQLQDLDRIFHNTVLRTVCLPLWKLWATVGGLLLIDLVAIDCIG